MLRAGGLLPYGREKFRPVRPAASRDDGRPRTLFEKIVLPHAVSTEDAEAVTAPRQSGSVRTDRRFIHDIYTGMCRHLLRQAFGEDLALADAAEAATRCALDAIQSLGGNGYINEHPTGRLLRDAKLSESGAGTSEIRRMLIRRELFDESA